MGGVKKNDFLLCRFVYGRFSVDFGGLHLYVHGFSLFTRKQPSSISLRSDKYTMIGTYVLSLKILVLSKYSICTGMFKSFSNNQLYIILYTTTTTSNNR